MAEPICYINGKRYVLPQGRGETTLLQFLRGALGQGLPGEGQGERGTFTTLYHLARAQLCLNDMEVHAA